MNCRSLVLIFAVSAFGVPVLTETPVAPYAGQQTRTIKALSSADVAIAKDHSASSNIWRILAARPAKLKGFTIS